MKYGTGYVTILEVLLLNLCKLEVFHYAQLVYSTGYLLYIKRQM